MFCWLCIVHGWEQYCSALLQPIKIQHYCSLLPFISNGLCITTCILKIYIDVQKRPDTIFLGMYQDLMLLF